MGDDIVAQLQDEIEYQSGEDNFDMDCIGLLKRAIHEIEHLRNELRGIPQGGFNPEEPL